MEKRKENEVRIAYLRPNEVIEKKKEKSVIYLPIGIIEWHGPHLPLGTDGFTAELCSLKAASNTGGVVLPTLFIGTERERPKEWVKNFGLDVNSYIKGMDMPALSYKSFYMWEEVLAIVIRNYIEEIIEHEYEVMYIVNGHGALSQNDVIKRLAIEYNAKQNTTKIMYAMSWAKESVEKLLFGHAAVDETAYIKYFDENLIDLSQLPPKEKPIKYYETGIVGPEAYSGDAPEDSVLPNNQDPRVDPSVSRGEKLLNEAVDEIVNEINKFFIK